MVERAVKGAERKCFTLGANRGWKIKGAGDGFELSTDTTVRPKYKTSIFENSIL